MSFKEMNKTLITLALLAIIVTPNPKCNEKVTSKHVYFHWHRVEIVEQIDYFSTLHFQTLCQRLSVKK